jgi:hypothetical protein
MIAELKEIMSSDHDLRTYTPNQEDNFGIWVTATIGTVNNPGGDLFQILICTPKWLSKEYLNSDRPLSWGHPMLLTQRFNMEEIVKFINDSLAKLSADHWEELSIMISRLGDWEFSNYTSIKN